MLFVLRRVNDVEKVQSLRPFPLQSTSVCIRVCLCVHACDKLEQDKQSQYSENMHIFLLLDVRGRRQGAGKGKEATRTQLVAVQI